MANTTIESQIVDILEGYRDGSYDDVYECANKISSLQTPSNEKYWRERCEAAERLLLQLENEEQEIAKNFREWQNLKSTPIPILTPCERVKELEAGLKEAITIMKGCLMNYEADELLKLLTKSTH